MNHARRIAPGAVLVFVCLAACEKTTVAPAASITFAQINAGATHTCGITPTAETYCWGQAGPGALGTDSVASSTRPVRVMAATGTYTSIDAGDSYTCALRSAGQLDCWGRGSSGQLGSAKHTNNPQPNAVGTNLKFTRVSLGGQHTCALNAAGDVYCWGAGGRGQLGNGVFADTALPSTRVAYSHLYKTVSAGQFHTCAITTESIVRCWGWNTFGQLGNNTTIGLAFPEPIATDARFVDVSGGQTHTCALSTTNDVYCWGDGSNGQLGSGSFDTSLKPIRVGGSQTFSMKAIAAGGQHTCALSSAGQAYCWGSNSDGQLGIGSFGGANSAPVAVQTNLRFNSITAGALHSCALTSDGRGYCWGFGGFGQLGTGGTESSSVPALIRP